MTTAKRSKFFIPSYLLIRVTTSKIRFEVVTLPRVIALEVLALALVAAFLASLRDWDQASRWAESLTPLLA
jgi:hypothetical protein